MKSMQYTIRAIPPQVDMALRKRAKTTGRSLNDITVEALAKGAGISKDAIYDDLDWFIGSMEKDPGFDDAIEWLNSLPVDMD